MVRVICSVVNPTRYVVRPLFDVLACAPTCTTKRPRTELIGYYTITHFVFASLVAVNDGVPLVCLVFTHRVVVLVIAEFCTIGGVFVEAMTRDGRDNFNAGRFLLHGEVHLSEVARFVVVCTIKLATAKGIGAVDGTSTAAPVAKQEGDGQIAFVGSSILETTLFTVVKHEQIGEISVNHIPSRP